MATGQQNYDKAFKLEAVQLVRTSGKSMRQIADDVGISNGTLSKWCQDLEKNGERAFVGSGNLQPEAEELKQLRRDLEIVRQERDIVKKPYRISLFLMS